MAHRLLTHADYVLLLPKLNTLQRKKERKNETLIAVKPPFSGIIEGGGMH